MKKITLVVVCLIIIATCNGCIVDVEKPYEGYVMGYKYELTTYTIQAVDDKENERFVITYTSLVDGNSLFFQCEFSYVVGEQLKNSNEFSYTDNLDSDIVFNEDGYYEFTGNRIFYVSYKNANVEIKESIANDDYFMNFTDKRWHP